MSTIRLYLLGTPRIERDGEEIELGLRKAVALAVYLAIKKQPQSRDLLAGLFWPESDQSSALANLRRTLYQVKKAIGDDILEVSGDTLYISDDLDLWIDAREFRRLTAEGLEQGRPNQALSREDKSYAKASEISKISEVWTTQNELDRLRSLQEAASLYAGDFMEGFYLPDSPAFDEWQFFEREALRGELARILERLARASLLQGEPEAGIQFARRWLGLDPLHEPAHRLLMELYARTGQQAAALRQYQECRRLLEDSLGVEPEAETQALFEAIQARKTLGLPQEAFVPTEIQYAQSGDVHIAYQVLGSGPVDVLVVTGFISHLEEVWKEPGLTAAVRRLAQSCRLILFDKRGVGLSDRVGYPPTLENTVDDMRAVMQAAGSEQAVFFGFSEGGPASLLFSATYPERTLGLILYGTMARFKKAPDYPWALTGEQYAKWIAWLQSSWGKALPHEYFAPSRAQDQALWEWFAHLLRVGSTPGEVQMVLEVTREIDVRQVLPAVRVPALVLHRTGDQTIRVGAGRYLAEHLPQARYIELPGDDHWWWLGDVQQLMQEMEGFVKGLKPAVVPDRALATILYLETCQTSSRSEASHDGLERAVREQAGAFRGRLRTQAQDRYLITFDGPSRAIQCSLALVREARLHGASVRIGLHSGECLIQGDRVQGPAVEVTREIMQAAEEGEVWLSRTVKDLVVGAGFSFEGRGELKLGGELGNWVVYRVG